MQTVTTQRFERRFAFFAGCFCAIVLLFVNELTFGQEQQRQPTMGELVIQTIPAKHYLQSGFETDFASMGEPVAKTLTELMEAARDGKVGLYGPVIHYYYGAPHQGPDRRFKMETGFFVAEGSAAVATFKSRELPTFKCAMILYVGPASRIGDAWQKLYRSVRAQGLTPTDEERELYLYWEGVDSPNNIVQVQLGIQ